MSDQFEIFGGGRWLYIDDPEFTGVDIGHDWMLEAGLRWHF